MVDSEGDLGDPDAAARTAAVENHHKWVEAAKFLGCVQDCHGVIRSKCMAAQPPVDKSASLHAKWP